MPTGNLPEPVLLVFSTTRAGSTDTKPQAEPSYTFTRLDTVLKYRSPAVRALPSLSSVGSLENAPRKMSVKESSAASAAA